MTPTLTITRTASPHPKTPTPVSLTMSLSTEIIPASIPTMEQNQAPQDERANFDYLLYAVFGLAIAGTALILFGSALKRRS
jgi:hypothetical protein